MRILFFVNTAWYFNLHWLERAKSFVNRGYEIHVLSSAEDEEATKEQFKQNGIIYWNMDIDRFSVNPVVNLKTLLAFRKYIKQINPTVIHLITIKPVLLGGIVLKLQNMPFVASFVGLGRLFNSTTLKQYSLLKKLIIKAYGFIFGDNRTAQVIFEHVEDYNLLSQSIRFAKGNIHIIDGAGIDVEKYQYHSERDDLQGVTILFAGRMLWSKGLGLLVDSVELVRQQGMQVKLQVAGIIDAADPDSIDLAVVEAWHKEGKIAWLGTRDDVELLIQNAHIVVLPTCYAEGVPRIILEACSVGRACIVGNVPGCQAIIQDEVNGLVLKTGMVPELAEYIGRLVQDKHLRRQYGQISSEIIKQRFAKEIIIEKTFSVYQAIIAW